MGSLGRARAKAPQPRKSSSVLRRCCSGPTQGACQMSARRNLVEGEQGSIPLNPKRACPSFVAATAGQREEPRRISGQQVVFGRLAEPDLESEGTSPVPLCRRGRAKRAAPSDVRTIECIVGTSQSPFPLLRHRCGRPAPRVPSNVSAMGGSPGPTTVGPMGVRSRLAAAEAGLRVRL